MEWEIKKEIFSNARLARNLFEDAVMNQSRRLVQQNKTLNQENLVTIKAEDIPIHASLLSEKLDDSR